MILIDVIIPTCKNFSSYNFIEDIKNTRITAGKIIYTGQQSSASKNRNLGLSRCVNDYIIMIDDDITGFYKGWDYDMIEPLEKNEKVLISSARLLCKDGKTIQNTVNGNMNIKDEIVIPEKQIVPSAAIAFRNNKKINFDENFIGSGFEDTDFCIQMLKNFPNTNIIINNKCKLIHINEMKNQVGSFFSFNYNYFKTKHGFVI